MVLETKLKGFQNIRTLKHALSLVEAILGKLHERFLQVFSMELEEKAFSELVIATCSHSSFKLRWLTAALQGQKKRIINIVNLEMKKVAMLVTSDEVAEDAVESGTNETSGLFSLMEDDDTINN